ncbi:MAG: glycosyltransferase family 4 protein [Patescibacteria group bacterium]|jgi:glycosyltransferase involved in cell wall biosynthesis
MHLKKKRKIAIIIDAWFPLIGGGQVYVQEIAQYLSRTCNFQVDIYTRRIFLSGSQHEKINLGDVVIHKIGLRTPFENIFSRLYFLVAVTFTLLIKPSYDLYLPQSIVPALVGKVVSFFKKRPAVLVIHGTSLFLKKEGFMHALEKFSLTGIKFSAEISVAHNFAKLSNVNKRIIVIPNGIDAAKFDVTVEKTEKPTALFVGRFDKIKGVEYLIQSFVEVRKRTPLAQLNLVGYGYNEIQLKSMVAGYRAESYIHFLGKQIGQNLIHLYKSSWLFVLPSLSEGHPLTLLEAQAAGLPVVVTDVGDNAYYVSFPKNGFIVQPRDVKAMTDSITTLMEDRGLRERVGLINREQVQQFTWQKTGEKTCKVLTNILHE